MKIRKFAPDAAIIMALTIAASSILAVGTAHASTYNPDIKVSKADLKRKCNNSGGDYVEEADGSYGCTVNYDDGSIVVIACDNPNDCVGWSDAKRSPADLLRGQRPTIQTTQVVQEVEPLPYTPISIRRNVQLFGQHVLMQAR